MQSLDARNAKLYEAAQSGKLAQNQILNMIKEKTSEVFKLDSEFRINDTNIKHTDELIETANQSLSSNERMLAEEKIKSENQKTKIGELEASLELIAKRQEEIEDAIFDEKCNIAKANNDIDTIFADIKRAEDEAVDIKVRISVLENARESGSDRNADVLGDIESYEEESARLERSMSQKKKTVADYDGSIKEIDESAEKIDTELTALNSEIGEKYDELASNVANGDTLSQAIFGNLSLLLVMLGSYRACALTAGALIFWVVAEKMCVESLKGYKGLGIITVWAVLSSVVMLVLPLANVDLPLWVYVVLYTVVYETLSLIKNYRKNTWADARQNGLAATYGSRLTVDSYFILTIILTCLLMFLNI